jgi:predicted permease
MTNPATVITLPVIMNCYLLLSFIITGKGDSFQGIITFNTAFGNSISLPVINHNYQLFSFAVAYILLASSHSS